MGACLSREVGRVEGREVAKRLRASGDLHPPTLRLGSNPLQRSAKDLGLILDRMAEVGPPVEDWIQAGVNREICGVPLIGGPPGQLARRYQPALREKGGQAPVPEMERQPEVVGRNEGVAAHVEADQVVATEQLSALDLDEGCARRVNQLNQEISALDVKGGSKEQQVLVVSAHELGEHGELVDTTLIDTQDRELPDRRRPDSSVGSKT